MKNHIWKIIGVVAVLAIGGSTMYSSSVSEQANEGIKFTDNVKGNPEATVVLTEYSDFQCPACAQFFPILQDVLNELGQDIRFEYRHLPLVQIHPYAIPAAKAAEAAGQQGKFFEMHDKLFENQSAWAAGGNANRFFNQYAEELELDMAMFKQHIKSSLITDKINNELKEARSLGLTGTPSFFLNGQPMQISTYQDFRDQISFAINPSSDVEQEEEFETMSADTPHTSSQPAVRFGF